MAANFAIWFVVVNSAMAQSQSVYVLWPVGSVMIYTPLQQYVCNITFYRSQNRPHWQTVLTECMRWPCPDLRGLGELPRWICDGSGPTMTIALWGGDGASTVWSGCHVAVCRCNAGGFMDDLSLQRRLPSSFAISLLKVAHLLKQPGSCESVGYFER